MVIDRNNEELRKKLLPAANNQPQITEASHLIIFAAWDNVTEERINEFVQNVSDTRGIPLESMETFKNRMAGLPKRSNEDNFNWAARQTYIALGNGLVAAAMEEVDATPMEGFNAPAFDDILGLKEKGLRSVTILALGYRDEVSDPIVKFKKVRRSAEKLFVYY